MIYIRLQEDYKVISRTLTRKSTLPKIGFISSIYREEKKPPNPQQSGSESPLTRLSVDRPVDRPKCAVRSTDPSVRSIAWSTAQIPTILQDLLDLSVDRRVDRLAEFSPLYQFWSIERSTAPNFVHVGQPPGRLNPVIELKNSISCFCPLSTIHNFRKRILSVHKS